MNNSLNELYEKIYKKNVDNFILTKLKKEINPFHKEKNNLKNYDLEDWEDIVLEFGISNEIKNSILKEAEVRFDPFQDCFYPIDESTKYDIKNLILTLLTSENYLNSLFDRTIKENHL